MNDFLKPEHSLRVVEGSVAKVDFYPDFVYWSPASFSRIEDLEQKADRQNYFTKLTEDIPFLTQLPVTLVDRNKHIYRQARAKGFNMDGSEYEVQGGGFVDFFSRLSIPTRIRGFFTYISVLMRLHDNGLIFNDHKPDSVFLDPVSGLSLPDTDKIKTADLELVSWQQEVEDGGSAFKATLRSFFTRNKLTTRFIPRVFEDNISTMSRLTSGSQIVETIIFMLNDGPRNKKHDGLMAELIVEEMRKLDIAPPEFSRDLGHLVDLSPVQFEMDELRKIFPNMGYNSSTAELVAHMIMLRQKEGYFRRKDQDEYSSKIM